MKPFVVLLVGMLALSPSSVALAQQSGQNEWGTILRVPVGTDLVIETKAGETIKGKLMDVKDSTLMLSRKDQSTAVELTQVQKAYQLVGRTRKKSTAIGAAAGGLAGLGIGLGVYLPDSNDIVGAVVPGLAIIGAGIGAAIGAATGKGRKKILIYEAK